MLWDDESFQIIEGMLSRPGVLLVLVDFIVTKSSIKVYGSDLKSSRSNIRVYAMVKFHLQLEVDIVIS